MSQPSDTYMPGIIGGLGPQAGVYFQQLLYDLTPATLDQDHVPYVYVSCPQVPDRNQYLLQDGPDYAPQLVDAIAVAQRAGATEVSLICMTAHEALPRIASQVSLPVYDVIGQTMAAVADDGVPGVMLLATTSTIESQLFHQAAQTNGLTLRVPDAAQQEVVMQVIYAVKEKRTDDAVMALRDLMHSWTASDASSFVLGCTELSALHDDLTQPNVTFYDPLRYLAQHIIDQTVAAPSPSPSTVRPSR